MQRDGHLFGPGPKKILSLDGGGIRGVVTLAFLEQIERTLEKRQGPGACLGDYFDLIGGTSTGAIIAVALALGYRTSEIKRLYFALAPLVFKHRWWSVPVLRPRFDARELQKHIVEIVGTRTLESPDLITGFAVVTKRMDTGAAWIVSNNPRAPFWETHAPYLGNRHYPLTNLVRASTAAPNFFDPELIPIALDEAVGPRERFRHDERSYGLFVDGAVTAYGNPALALLHLATFKQFGMCWTPGVGSLMVTSVGTGSFRPRISYNSLGFARFPKLAYHALLSMVSDSALLTLTMMQWLGECRTPWVVNSEIGTLAGDAPPGGKMFTFQRYDVHLDRDWIASELNRRVAEEDVVRLRNMADPKSIPLLYELGQAAAEAQVDAGDWL